MGVGSDMFIRESADMVAGFRSMSANAVAPVSETPGEPPPEEPLVANVSLVGGAEGEEWRPERVLKHSEQYTGRPCVGRKGKVVDEPQSAQTAWWRGIGLDKPGRLGRVSKGMWKRTPSSQPLSRTTSQRDDMGDSARAQRRKTEDRWAVGVRGLSAV